MKANQPINIELINLFVFCFDPIDFFQSETKMKIIFSNYKPDHRILTEINGEWKKHVKESNSDLEESHYIYQFVLHINDYRKC